MSAIILQCKNCSNLIRFKSDTLANITCQKCGKNSFSFDSKFLFIKKDGIPVEAKETFTSEAPFLYTIKEIPQEKIEVKEEKEQVKKQPEVEVEVKVFVPEEKKPAPKKIRLPRRRIK